MDDELREPCDAARELELQLPAQEVELDHLARARRRERIERGLELVADAALAPLLHARRPVLVGRVREVLVLRHGVALERRAAADGQPALEMDLDVAELRRLGLEHDRAAPDRADRERLRRRRRHHRRLAGEDLHDRGVARHPVERQQRVDRGR